MKPWHIRDPQGYVRQRAEVERDHPYLHFQIQDREIGIAGSLEIKEAAKVLDRYSIRINLPESYPESVPVVFEVGGRIPRTLDRHCFDGSGASCVLLPEERWKIWPKGSSLLRFIDGPVRNYFINQAVFERDGVWPFGEWEHGFYGQKQYYRETFGTDDSAKVGKYFEYLAAKRVKGHWGCPCGSGKRLRDCHMRFVQDLRGKMPRGEALKATRRLESALNRLSKQ